MYQNVYFDGRSIHLWDDKLGYRKTPYKRYAYLYDKGGKFTALDGTRLKKVFRYDKEDENLYESDVIATTRTLVDQYTDSDEPSVGHRTMIFDIEVEVTEGFPSPSKAENKITAIALWDSVTDEYYCYILDPENKLEIESENRVLKKGNNTIIGFKSEIEMLNAFLGKYCEIRPTIITGWNTDNFDIPYLYNRVHQLLGQEFAGLLSPIGVVKYSEYRQRFEIAGVSSLDYLALYKKFTPSLKPSYRLDAVGEDEVGIKKVSYEGTLNELYENDRKKFVAYNLNDVHIVVELDKKLDYIETSRGICHIGHVSYEDIYASSRYLEGAILVYCKKIDVVVPNKNKDARKLMAQRAREDKFAGAYVQEPQKGRHEWVFDLDITSMYPSVIRSLNISPETKIGKVVGWKSKEFIKKDNKKTYTIEVGGKDKGKLTESELKEYFEKTNVSISSNGILYRMDKIGLIPAILGKWSDDRVQFRKLAKQFNDDGNEKKFQYFNRRQYLQKILLNSLYGVLGLPVFRFYDIDNAEATTLTGQELIKYSKKITNHYYNKELGTDEDYVIYIDTDSIFASATPLVKARHKGIDTNAEVIMTQHILNIANEIQNYLNQSYDLFAKRFLNLDKHYFEIKQEVIAKSSLFITKKRYGMKIINEDGRKVNKTLVKGLDTVRSSFAKGMKTLLSEVLEDLLANVPKEQIDKRIFKFKKGMKAMDYDDIASPTGVKRLGKFIKKVDERNFQVMDKNIGGKLITTYYMKATPVHVKASLAYNDMIEYYGKKKYPKIVGGEKIKWVYLKQNPLSLAVLAYKGNEDPPEILQYIKKYIDVDKLYNQALKKKIRMFYDAMGYGLPVDERYTLERFF